MGGPQARDRAPAVVVRTVTIGRAPDCDIVLDDEYVSPRHCVLIEHLPGEWAAECWGTDGLGVILREDAAYDISHHFTVGSVVVLRPGDVLVIGRTRMPPFTPERVAA